MLKQLPRVNPSETQAVSKPSLRTLFETEETPLLRYAYSLVGRRTVAEEIVQEVFLQLHARWDDVEAPRAWLFRSVRNRAYNYGRDNQREVINSESCEEQLQTAQEESPDATLLRRETADALRQLVEKLNETDQRLIKLKYFDQLKYREISVQTGLSVSNVGYRLHHILKKLAENLRSLGIDGRS